jgi:hypothetical protein
MPIQSKLVLLEIHIIYLKAAAADKMGVCAVYDKDAAVT